MCTEVGWNKKKRFRGGCRTDRGAGQRFLQ
jgi:hypothetical protein